MFDFSLLSKLGEGIYVVNNDDKFLMLVNWSTANTINIDKKA